MLLHPQRDIAFIIFQLAVIGRMSEFVGCFWGKNMIEERYTIIFLSQLKIAQRFYSSQLAQPNTLSMCSIASIKPDCEICYHAIWGTSGMISTSSLCPGFLNFTAVILRGRIACIGKFHKRGGWSFSLDLIPNPAFGNSLSIASFSHEDCASDLSWSLWTSQPQWSTDSVQSRHLQDFEGRMRVTDRCNP